MQSNWHRSVTKKLPSEPADSRRDRMARRPRQKSVGNITKAIALWRGGRGRYTACFWKLLAAGAAGGTFRKAAPLQPLPPQSQPRVFFDYRY
jgi:hypothetical protein